MTEPSTTWSDAGTSVGGTASSVDALLAKTLSVARRRTRLTLPEAARALGVAAETLEAIETGRTVPARDVLEHAMDLYPLDGKALLDMARLQTGDPDFRARLVQVETLLAHMEDCLAREPGAAERQGGYFSIGHLSDRLLKALQDPKFHAIMEQMAETYDGDPAKDGASPPSGDAETASSSGKDETASRI